MSHHYLYGNRRALPQTDAYARYFEAKETAVVSIDMHEGHLSDSPECPCPAPRGRAVSMASLRQSPA